MESFFFLLKKNNFCYRDYTYICYWNESSFVIVVAIVMCIQVYVWMFNKNYLIEICRRFLRFFFFFLFFKLKVDLNPTFKLRKSNHWFVHPFFFFFLTYCCIQRFFFFFLTKYKISFYFLGGRYPKHTAVTK